MLGVGRGPGSHQAPSGERQPDYDVIVVGGRVAGASTGMLLARQGHRVLILERASMPSDTVSTHAILRSGVLQLTRWGILDRIVEAGTPPIGDITLGFGSERIDFQVRPDFDVDTFYAPRRHLLDQILVEAAEEAGADFVDSTSVVGLTRDDRSRVNGVRIGRGARNIGLTAHWVIGADGHRSRVAEQVGAKMSRHHEATNAVHYAYFEGIDATRFWFQFTPGVNAGIIPTNDEQCLMFVGRPAHLRPLFTRDPDGEFARLIAEAGSDLADSLDAGRRTGKFRGTSGLAGFIRQAWGPGWALVGDAGFTKDPISAHGISDALRDAELCARAVDRSLRSPEQATESMRTYETLRDSLSVRMFEESEQLARFEWTPEEASRRMRAISEEVRRECDVLVSLPDWDEADALVGAVAPRRAG